MDWTSVCAVAIPCFNEAPRIGRVVLEVQHHLPSVFVLDDGSTDATAQIARHAGAEILHLGKNYGKGRALRSGWRRLHELGFQWALMMDGDGQHSPADIPKFLACATSEQAKLVIGNRMTDPAPMPPLRRCVNRWMSRRISRLTGRDLPDSQCGFRLAHLGTLVNLPLRACRFEIESEMLVAFLAAGKTVEFVPIQTIYESGESKINPLTDSWRWLRWRVAQRTHLRACSTIRVQ